MKQAAPGGETQDISEALTQRDTEIGKELRCLLACVCRLAPLTPNVVAASAHVHGAFSSVATYLIPDSDRISPWCGLSSNWERPW
jgi:hypothetical protein